MLKINKFVLITGILVILLGVTFVSSKYLEADYYLGESYRQIQETIDQIDQIIELQESEDVFWIIEGNLVTIVKQTTREAEIVNVTLAEVDKRLTEIVDDERWVEIRDSLKDLQNKIDSAQLMIEDHNNMQEQLAQMVGVTITNEISDEQEIKLFNMNSEAFFEESDIINSYANENGLDSSTITISDVVDAGYVYSGIPISGISEGFRNLAREIKDKSLEIRSSFLDMRGDVNEIGKKVNDIYDEETISVCEDVCVEGAKESIYGGERECYYGGLRATCLNWNVQCFQGYTPQRQTDNTITCVAE